MIEHKLGQTCVPLNPQRVIVLGYLENVLALGIKPVGNDLVNNIYPHMEDKIEGIENLGDFTSPSLEKILTLKPDLILGDNPVLEAKYEVFSQVAPTALAPFSDGRKWKENFMWSAQVLGRTEKAQAIMANYYARLEEFKNQMGDRLDQIKVSVVRIYPDVIAVYPKDSFCGSVLEDAGLSRPPSQNKVGGQQRLSKERMRDLDGDVMFLWTYGHNPEISQQANTTLKKLKADPLWSQLKVVQQGKVYEVPGYWIGDGPLAANAMIDDLFKYLIETVSSNLYKYLIHAP
ncbi:iron-siderophore ABC transporter substrate-binding protein [Gloeocapsopsis dulcis]|nr:iron-siderophore ABC transporter substrate-binding protein [Gloeocapsopsis dulcis]WNN89733.1 iron-siderophore ABC transporter substrate-binding protein [Gloeocapsopsis dulcis]